jgi:hypothetical protein
LQSYSSIQVRDWVRDKLEDQELLEGKDYLFLEGVIAFAFESVVGKELNLLPI